MYQKLESYSFQRDTEVVVNDTRGMNWDGKSYKFGEVFPWQELECPDNSMENVVFSMFKMGKVRHKC